MKLLFPIFLLLTVVIGCSGVRPQKEWKVAATIAKEDVSIAPGEWKTWKFTADKASRVSGSYSTKAGVDHEIVFYVVDPANKDSIQKNQTGAYEFRSLDSRTRRHLTSVSREIPAGEYYLMFLNESRSTDHTVEVRMYLEQ